MPRGCSIALLLAASLSGALMVIVALLFVVVNETQVDLPTLANESRVLRADDPGAPAGALVSLTGQIVVAQPGLGDDMFLKPGNYLEIERIAEMYAWQEYRDGEDAAGKPRYRKRKAWTRSPESGLLNPSMPFTSETLRATNVQIDGVAIQMDGANLPVAEKVVLTPELLLPDAKGTINNDRLYLDGASVNLPQLGDMRVSYYAIPAGQQVTVFGAVEQSTLIPYHATDGRDILRVIEGDRAAALQELGAVEAIGDWLIRVLAVVALWLGLLLVFYGSRRLLPWPQWFRVSVGSVPLATVLGPGTAVLAIASLWLSQGNVAIFAAVLGLELLAVFGWLFWQRSQPVMVT